MSEPAPPRILAWATKGAGTNEEQRLCDLLSGVRCDVFPFDRTRKIDSFRRLRCEVLRGSPDLLVMEGTGVAGGLACLWARWLRGTPFIVSSGDAVGPWVSTRLPLIGFAFGAYERLLCRSAAGYIGWSPYLVGRALSFGVPRAMTAAGWAPFRRTEDQLASSRARVREQLDIPQDAIVFGIVGSLVWSSRARYCYGLELVS